MSFMTEAAATLEYETYDYSLPHSKTVDLIGEEFIKKEHTDGSIQTTAGLLQLAISSATQRTFPSNSLPPLTYTTTTIPTISTQVSSSEENGVLYCNLDDLSKYIPDNFSFDTIIPENMEADSVHDSMSGISEYSKVQVLSLPTQPLPVSVANQHYNSRPMTISFPSAPDPRYGPGGASTVQIQLRAPSSTPSSVQTFNIPTIDTTKLTGQLSVVQELPEVSKLVFQEVKQEQSDSIVNILENMKQEEPGSLSPLDYTVSSTSEGPLNLVNNLAKGIKRVTAPVQNLPHDAKRMKNVYIVQGQNGQQIIQEVPVSYMDVYNNQRSTPSPMSHDLIHGGHNITSSVLCIDPPSPISYEIKKEPKSKSASPKLHLTKTVNGTTIPSSKTCNWVFENGQVCGKTFSKSYNLVVHMRMHEDIRPFACTLCDQTFRQKAHLQRHETTHGIQTKNFYRTPASKKKKKRPAQKLSKNLQDRLARVNQNLNKSNGDCEDSEGEEYMEDDEDDLYVPNGNQSKRASIISRKYSDNDKDQANGLDNEMDNDGPTSLRDGYFVARGKLKNMVDSMHEGLMEEGVNMQVSKNLNDSRDHFQVKQEIGDMNMNIITQNDDDDNSTVQDILQNVNSVPTLEQKLESSQFLNCDNLLLRALPTSRPIMSVSAAPSYPVTTSSFNLPHTTKMVESTLVSNINNLSMANSPSLPANLTTTSAQNLPGTSLAYSLFHSTPSAQTNILFSTLSAPTSTVSSSHKSLSFIETSVPASTVSANCYTTSISSSNRQLVIDNIDDHSPEIQAEILNALLADETYVDSEQQQVEELWEEEIFRLNTLPSTWWVSRRRKSGTIIGDMSYYSPQGYCFKNRSEIQDFLQNNLIPKDMRSSELRSPPLPIEQIPIIEDNFVQRTSMPSNMPMDTNSIAQALIANLKPEPIESLKEALNSESKLRDSLSLGPTCSANVLTLSTVS